MTKNTKSLNRSKLSNRIVHDRSSYFHGAVERAVRQSEHAQDGRRPSPLGITTLKSSDSEKTLRRASFRRTLAKARELNYVLFRHDKSFDRLAFCGSVTSDDHVVGVKRGSNGNVFTKGTARCANIWACLNCANSIRVERAQFYQQVCKEHLASGKGILFATLTSSHTREDDLGDLWDINQKAWRRITGGDPWKRNRESFGIEAMLVTRETTHSNKNGWHHHLHVLIFLDSPISPLSDRYKNIRTIIIAMSNRSSQTIP